MDLESHNVASLFAAWELQEKNILKSTSFMIYLIDWIPLQWPDQQLSVLFLQLHLQL